MSQGIPIAAVLNEAFQFGLQRWGTIIRFAWAPLVVSMLLVAGYFGLIIDFAAISEASKSGAQIGLGEFMRLPASAAIGFGLVIYVIVALLFSGIMASVFRLVALGEDEKRFINIRIDGPAWRVFWASIITGLISTAIWCVALGVALPLTGKSIAAYFTDTGSFFTAVFSIVSTGNAGSDQIAAIETSFLGAYWKSFLYAFLIALVPLIYVSVRLAPFLSGSASENRLLLMGSLDLTKGHFWPILGAMFLMGLMIVVIGVVYELVGSLFEVLMGLGGLGGAFAIIVGIISFLYFAVSIFYYAVIYGAQLAFNAIIYRRLKTGE